MGGPSIPAPPPPPDPIKSAQANDLFYRSSLETYIQKQPDIAALETRLREKYQPRQRKLESELAALDSRRAAESALQTERELGPQRTLEAMRRQFEMSPAAFSLNRGLGDQNAAALPGFTGRLRQFPRKSKTTPVFLRLITSKTSRAPGFSDGHKTSHAHR